MSGVTRPGDADAGQPLGSLRREVLARREAIQAIREAAKASNRFELTTALRAELARRGVHEEPLWIEQQIDLLLANPRHPRLAPHEELRAIGQAGKGLGAVGLIIIKALRGQKPPTTAPPAWLAPPTAARYSVAQSQEPGRRWAEVTLNDGSSEYLDRAYSAMPRPFKHVSNSVTLDAWLTERSNDRQKLDVCLGETHVGTLDLELETAYQPFIASASIQGELPRVPTRLTPIAARPEGYLMEIARPAPRD